MRRIPALALGLVFMAALACGDNDEGSTEPPPPPTTGGILVSLVMSGGDMDPDGCTVTVDRESAQHLNAGETVTFSYVPAGTHEIAIDDVATNCQVDGDVSRSLPVVAGETTRDTFSVGCDWRTRIAFLSDRDGSLEIYAMNPDGTGVLELNGFPGVRPHHLAWSPDGTRIAFALYLCDDTGGACPSEIYAINADGTGFVNLTNHVASDMMPAWSPDGTRIAFSSNRAGNGYDCYVMNADGTEPVSVAYGGCSVPAWSPDGTRIAISLRSDISVVNADGTGLVSLSNGHSPDWSPDGARIAFSSFRDGYRDIYVMNADGTGELNLTNDPAAEDDKPIWSPDGARIAFWSSRDGNYEGYVMNADGTGPVNVTKHSAADYEPFWSPDGTRIAFSSDRDGNRDIYVVNADGSGVVNLTKHPAEDYGGVWSPVLY